MIKAIDTNNFTDYNRSERDLEALLFFSVMVAGKTASHIEKKVNELFFGVSSRPFNYLISLKRQGELENRLRHFKLGKYNNTVKFVCDIEEKDLNLKEASLEDLLSLHGVGDKTARMFLLHSRRDVKVAVLDTHILKFCIEVGIDCGKGTPSAKNYLRIEQEFLEWVDENKGKTVEFSRGSIKIPENYADLDLNIWKMYRK